MDCQQQFASDYRQQKIGCLLEVAASFPHFLVIQCTVNQWFYITVNNLTFPQHMLSSMKNGLSKFQDFP